MWGYKEILCTHRKSFEYGKVTAYNWQRDKSGLHPNDDINMEIILQKSEDMHIYTIPETVNWESKYKNDILYP